MENERGNVDHDARFAEIFRRLKKDRPAAECELTHDNPFQLLIAVILSAQCTDARVNRVTPVLFKKYPTAEKLAKAPIAGIEKIIRSTGFFRSKAKSIQSTSEKLIKNFGGRVPKTMDELLTLSGVARKTANVVLGTAYGIPAGVVVDTHVSRVSRRLGLTQEKDPRKIEKDLMKLLPKKDWIYGGHLILLHGRYTCKAKKPDCPHCLIGDLCPSRKLFLGIK